jgi:hypothetical protein
MRQTGLLLSEGQRMKKLLLVLLTGLAMAGVANPSYAQHRGGSFHGSNAFHGSGFHNDGFRGGFHNDGFHHFHHDRFHHRFFFISAPFFWGPGFFPYLYPYPYPVTSYDYLEPPLPYAAPQQDYLYYCPDQGYYPSVQICPKGWLRVVPEHPSGL